jgi:hypothetical protein
LKLYDGNFSNRYIDGGVRMGIFEVNIQKINENLQIQWQLSSIEIPLSDINEIVNDDTYGGEEKSAIRIGNPYGHTDRVVIKTKTGTYILFTSIGGLKEKILSYMDYVNQQSGELL